MECKVVHLIGSVETTHGVIRAYSGDWFLFVSGITDRLGRFKEEVTPASYAGPGRA